MTYKNMNSFGMFCKFRCIFNKSLINYLQINRFGIKFLMNIDDYCLKNNLIYKLYNIHQKHIKYSFMDISNISIMNYYFCNTLGDI